MKKIISLISLFIIVLVLSGCSNTRINDPIEKAIDFSDLQLAYDEMHYENEVIQTIHDEYNQYFFGIYMDNGVIGVSIKNDIPSSGLDLLDESDIPYKFVKYNYTELINIYYLVVVHEKFGEYGGAGVNFVDNFVEVYTPIGYIFPEEFLDYVEEGSIILIESDLVTTFN